MKHYKVGDIIRILSIFVKQAGWIPHIAEYVHILYCLGINELK